MSDFFVGPYVSFGFGYPIGFFPYPWGWGFWGCNWGGRFVVFNHARFFSHSHTFFDHGHGFAHGGDFHGHDFHGFHSGEFHGQDFHDFHGAGTGFDHREARGFAAPHVAPNGHPGAFSGFDHGGMANHFSGRGQSSFGGGFHGGGGFNGGARGGFAGGCMAAASAAAVSRRRWRFSWRRWRRPQVIGGRRNSVAM